MNFKTQRKEQDATLVLTLGVRTRADVRRVAAEHGYASDDLSLEAITFRDKLFCAAARVYGATPCGACSNLTINTEINHHRDCPPICDECMEQVDEAVHGLPQWVKDRDLTEVIPALVRAFTKTAREARDTVAV